MLIVITPSKLISVFVPVCIISLKSEEIVSEFKSPPSSGNVALIIIQLALPEDAPSKTTSSLVAGIEPELQLEPTLLSVLVPPTHLTVIYLASLFSK